MIELDDKAKIKQIDLKAYLEQFVTFKKRCSSQHGGGYSGPCPICGGDDRFMVYPALGICLCRHCSPSTKWEDIISFTSRMNGTGFHQTCEFLLNVTDGLPTVDLLPSELLAPDPSDEWRRAGEEVVRQCIETLWAPEGAAIKKWLNDRHLKDGTLKRWSIGASMKWQVIGGLNVPPGIIIPWYFEGKLWHLKVRVNEQREGTKYKAVVWRDNDRKNSCGVPVLYGTDTLQGHERAVLCEGEFDAILLHQEAGDLVGVITPGSCGAGIDARAVPHLLPINHLFVAYDLDNPGQAGAEAVKKTSDRVKIVSVFWGKDITDFKKSGGDLREWIESFINDPSVVNSNLHSTLSTDPDHPPGDGADRDQAPTYLEALTARIQALEAEYTAAYGEPVPGEADTCRELSWKAHFPAEQQRKYNERYTALSTIERLKRERSTALSEGRTRWTPGLSDELLRQKGDGLFVPAELAGLDQADPPSEVTAIMGTWNQMIYGKKAVKCTRTAPGVVKCELVGDVQKHELEIPKGKKSEKTPLDGLKKGA